MIPIRPLVLVFSLQLANIALAQPELVDQTPTAAQPEPWDEAAPRVGYQNGFYVEQGQAATSGSCCTTTTKLRPELAFGFNVYLKEHLFKWQNDLTALSHAATDTTDWIVRSQAQLSF